jgi:hypothetical protein
MTAGLLPLPLRGAYDNWDTYLVTLGCRSPRRDSDISSRSSRLLDSIRTMRLFQKTKDGGPNSPVDAYFLIEWKNVFSVAILKFNIGTRDAYHTHAFNAWTWFLKGNMVELDISGKPTRYTRSIFPKFTPKTKNHKVVAATTSYAITLRGPWDDTWTETKKGETITLTHGRKHVL